MTPIATRSILAVRIAASSKGRVRQGGRAVWRRSGEMTQQAYCTMGAGRVGRWGDPMSARSVVAIVLSAFLSRSSVDNFLHTADRLNRDGRIEVDRPAEILPWNQS